MHNGKRNERRKNMVRKASFVQISRIFLTFSALNFSRLVLPCLSASLLFLAMIVCFFRPYVWKPARHWIIYIKQYVPSLAFCLWLNGLGLTNCNFPTSCTWAAEIEEFEKSLKMGRNRLNSWLVILPNALGFFALLWIDRKYTKSAFGEDFRIE